MLTLRAIFSVSPSSCDLHSLAQPQLHVTNKMSDGKKRRNNQDSGTQSNKKSKVCIANPLRNSPNFFDVGLTITAVQSRDYWSKSVNNYQTITGIETGSEGIFATCDRGTEPKCVGEMYGLLEKVRYNLAATPNRHSLRATD